MDEQLSLLLPFDQGDENPLANEVWAYALQLKFDTPRFKRFVVAGWLVERYDREDFLRAKDDSLLPLMRRLHLIEGPKHFPHADWAGAVEELITHTAFSLPPAQNAKLSTKRYRPRNRKRIGAMKEVNAITKPWTGLSTAALVFTGLVCLWTLSHNLDLYDSGLSTRGRVIGRIGCLAAEAFALWSVIQFLKYGGARGRASKHASFAMLAVLLVNTVIASLKAQGKAASMGSLMDMYSLYGVPIAFSFVIVWGLHHVLSHDPDSRENDIRADEQELSRTVKMDTQTRLHQSVQSKLQDDSVKKMIDDAANELVQQIVAEATGTRKTITVGSRKVESVAALKAEPVELMADPKPTAQYVNGKAHSDPKDTPRRDCI